MPTETGPPKNLAKLDDNLRCRNAGNREKEKVVQFFVRLCDDVLLEVLRYGDRYRITKMERIGRRFHFYVENFFGSSPFLRLDLELMLGHKITCFIVCNERTPIYPAELIAFPQFLRFNEVHLWYHFLGEPIASKCHSVQTNLQPLKRALSDSIVITLHAQINYNDSSCFNGRAQFLNHIQNELLPICASSRGYRFDIDFFSDENDGANAIASLLNIFAIKRCLNVEITIKSSGSGLQMQLPVESISSWLNQKCDGINEFCEDAKELILRIYSCKIQNPLELCDYMKKTFKEANFSVRPYTFKLFFNERESGLSEDEEKILVNKDTSEQLSVHTRRQWSHLTNWLKIKIKRGDPKKESKTSSTSSTRKLSTIFN